MVEIAEGETCDPGLGPSFGRGALIMLYSDNSMIFDLGLAIELQVAAYDWLLARR